MRRVPPVSADIPTLVTPGSVSGDRPEASALLACVILAHTDPVHVRRLIDALDPFPVFLHCDSRASPGVFAAMTTDLPQRCTVLPRMKTGWARWENVAAELAGFRTALESTFVTHVALLTGADYPLASAEEITDTLTACAGQSITYINPLPYDGWGASGGLDRLKFRHWAVRKHMIRIPIPRRLPPDIVLSGGSQLKILSRAHAQAVVDIADRRPDLVRFWRRSWVADETFIPSLLGTSQYFPNWSDEHIRATPWWIGWDGTRRKSPPWLGTEQTDAVLSRRNFDQQELPSLFARKFTTGMSDPILDAIDASRSHSAPAAVVSGAS
ncbi:beta-1,6-N-acetylglucosaminyltransferase [Cryobacterium sp. Y57]|uniref:beta-1,6-N-acetylglucosaminyltransferase n=1 Tax=Cryobacterium sp. Y57 TaxID=2048287 RepID=UPI000CE38E4D|nr:beta-1,6-N-acetylglucosaminyltransferase [Cryobacterium sp. Y57]